MVVNKAEGVKGSPLKVHLRIWRLYAVIILTVGCMIWWWCCLPQPLFQASYSTVLYNTSGELLGAQIARDGQWRFPETQDEVPDHFAQAIIHFEDKRFYTHGGVDAVAMCRAIWTNLRKRAVISGGSTLTMQTMRMARGRASRSVWQKMIEVLWALRMELTYSKKEILSIYAAHAPFGGNVVGLHAASWRYFQKMPDQLSWSEAAALAVLPNAPGMIHPGRNREEFLQKRNRLIKLLSSKGIIDAMEASLAMQEPLPDVPFPLPVAAPHVMNHISQSGKIWRTTLDLQLQERATELLQRHADILSLNGVNNAALLIMDTESGDVKAYVGNVSHADKLHENDVDIIRSERSSGSIMKPFLYCAALQEGLITPKGIVEDIPTYIRGYQPLNFSKTYNGMVAADQALSMSLNIPLVRLLQRYGILPFKEKLERAGITTLHFSPEHYGLPLILGGAEVSVWDICGAYASMGRVLSHMYVFDGKYFAGDIHPPVLFEEEKTYHAQQLEKAKKEKDRLQDVPDVWDAGAIWQTFEAMSAVRRPDQEGQWEIYSGSRKMAWKTGTSFGFRDAWAVGITPEFTIGVWIGNADGEGRPDVIGLHAAAPVLFDALRLLESSDDWWSQPYDVMTPLSVCQESGWPAGPYCQLTDTIQFVKNANMPAVCSFHVQCYTDREKKYRYDPVCADAEASLYTFFTVPALAENYYKKYHPAYMRLPPLHPTCEHAAFQEENMALIYPRSGSKIYIPYEWDKQKSRAVFSAVHRSETSTIYWHLDKQFIGKTREFHQIEVDPLPGIHVLTLQDENGSMVAASFEVLSK